MLELIVEVEWDIVKNAGNFRGKSNPPREI